jgi:hypothetical protein
MVCSASALGASHLYLSHIDRKKNLAPIKSVRVQFAGCPMPPSNASACVMTVCTVLLPSARASQTARRSRGQTNGATQDF